MLHLTCCTWDRGQTFSFSNEQQNHKRTISPILYMKLSGLVIRGYIRAVQCLGTCSILGFNYLMNHKSQVNRIKWIRLSERLFCFCFSASRQQLTFTWCQNQHIFTDDPAGSFFFTVSCDRGAEGGWGRTLTLWSHRLVSSLSPRSKPIQLVVILTSTRRGRDPPTPNTHTVARQLDLPAKCWRARVRVCVCV